MVASLVTGKIVLAVLPKDLCVPQGGIQFPILSGFPILPKRSNYHPNLRVNSKKKKKKAVDHMNVHEIKLFVQKAASPYLKAIPHHLQSTSLG
jgi:hypothetical protein